MFRARSWKPVDASEQPAVPALVCNLVYFISKYQIFPPKSSHMAENHLVSLTHNRRDKIPEVHPSTAACAPFFFLCILAQYFTQSGCRTAGFFPLWKVSFFDLTIKTCSSKDSRKRMCLLICILHTHTGGFLGNASWNSRFKSSPLKWFNQRALQNLRHKIKH